MIIFRSFAYGVLAVLMATSVCANNIQVNNLTLTGTNTVAGTTQVQFDITWANSWRTSSAPNNWDAAWIFVKYLDATTGLWQHARLGSNAQHSAPAGSTIATGLLTPSSAFNATTNWGVGAFLYRSANGTGTFSPVGVQLRWNYGQNDIAFQNIAEVKVFAVEMVYVPQGSFSVGGGGSETGRFKNGTTNNPWPINSEGAINMANVDGSLWAVNDTYIETATLPATFPKGFAGFYLMKYEITQQQFVDFLNTLTRTQQNTLTNTNLAVGVTSVSNRYVMSGTNSLQARNGIRCDGTIDANNPITFYCDLNGNGIGGEATDGQWIACNSLNWPRVVAYLDWCGLRPMTELEFEKACRGPVAPVPNGYAWGSAAILGAANITDGGAINESSNTIGANAVYNDNGSVPGPMRVGVFATGAATRVQSGAGYYGAMELSGNLMERTVSVDHVTGRGFVGILGNGALDATGNADAATWPGNFNSQGHGCRGGDRYSPASELRVADRTWAGFSGGFSGFDIGGRGVRQFP